jgi:hypothetical protein
MIFERATTRPPKLLTVRSRLQQTTRMNLGGLTDLKGNGVLGYIRLEQPTIAGFDVQSDLDVGGTVDYIPIAVEIQCGEEAGERAVIVVPSAPIAEFVRGIAIVIVRLVVFVVGGGILLLLLLLGWRKVMEQSRLAAFRVAEDPLEFPLVAGALGRCKF